VSLTVRPLRGRDAVLAIALAAAAVTATVVAWPVLHYAYRQHGLHIGFEATAGQVACLAAYLIFGRFRRTRRFDDLLLSYAFALFALANLCFAALPAIVLDGKPNGFSTWTALAGRLVGAVAFAVAALAPARELRLSPLRKVLVFVTPVAVLAATAVVVLLFESRLPTGVEAEFTPASLASYHVISHPVLLTVQLASIGLFGVAAFGFARRAGREEDEVMWWLAAGGVLALFASLNYVLYPSLYTEYVYVGDGFRLLFYATVLIAAARELSSYWRALAHASVLEERRRIARDLHDGLAQELAFIGRNLQRLDEADVYVARARAATGRALAEARRAVAALSDAADRPLEVVLEEAVREVAAREGTRVELELASGLTVTPEQREALVRIACEAIANAARHGQAKLVRVELADGPHATLRVADRGCGFDPAATQPRTGFGLVSMRDRARALGADFRLSSGLGRGTEVEVSF
jgi:signal transduction histidine kinase